MPGALARFMIYGALGWCAEVLFTGLGAVIVRRDRKATGTTYLWMFPIYGCGALLLEGLHGLLAAVPWLLRAFAYLVAIYVVELSSGMVLRRLLGRCPWDYGSRGLNILGLVRLDYAPAWLLVALLFEPASALAHVVTVTALGP